MIATGGRLEAAGLDHRLQGVDVAGHVVDAGLVDLAADEDLERSGGLHRHIDFGPAKLAGIGGVQGVLGLDGRPVGHHHRPHQGQADAAVGLDHHGLVELGRRGHGDVELVAGIEPVRRLVVAPGGVADVLEGLPGRSALVVGEAAGGGAHVAPGGAGDEAHCGQERKCQSGEGSGRHR